jgi:hypothetical protein
MSIIFEALSLYKIIESSIDASTLTSAEELFTFELGQRDKDSW